MSLNGKKVTDFSLQAYQKGAFKEITSHALEGKWSVFFFYPADFTFVQICMKISKMRVVKFTPFPAIHTLSIKHGMNRQLRSVRWNFP